MMIEYNARQFYDCDSISGINDTQKQYLNALIDLAPRKPRMVFIDHITNYAWFRYSKFDYPINLTYLGVSTVGELLASNIPDIAYNLTACEDW